MLFLKIFIYLFGCPRSQLQHVGSSSLTRDQTWAPCTGSLQSQALDHQGRPLKFFFNILHMAGGILVPQPVIKLMPPTLEAQSLNHWPNRVFPNAYKMKQKSEQLIRDSCPQYIKNFTSPTTKIQIKNGQRTRISIFPKKIYKWPISM